MSFMNISYQLDEASPVSIDLYDIGGQLIVPLIKSEMRSKGTSLESISIPSQINDGIYFICVKTDNSKQISKVVIQH